VGRPNKFLPEVLERAVRMVFEHREEYDSEWSAMRSIATKIGCTGETLRSWVPRVELEPDRISAPAA
jgi:hypothetical protein